MGSSLPEWMTKEFFEQCLRKEEHNNNIVVTNLTTSSAVPPGNNYGSFIIRVELEWRVDGDDSVVKTSRFIVKAELTEGPLQEMMTAQFAMYEPSFYYKFIPKAKQCGDINFAPKCFFSPKPNVTVLEDLKETGFLMVDRTKQLDFDHCRLYMIAAASFHSVSIPVYKNNPDLMSSNDSMFSNESKMRDIFHFMIKSGTKRFVQEIDKVDRFKKHSKTIKDVSPHLWDMMVEAHKPSEQINTIKQGDPWITNMMFKYDRNNKVCDIKIIDFQGIGYGSPVTDLMFFLWSSANSEVKQNRLDELYRIYVDSFNKNLKKFNCSEKLTYEQVIQDVEKLKPLALFISCSSLPGLLHPEPMDLAAFFSKDASDDAGDKFFDKYYTKDYCEKIFPQVVESLEINGVFSYLQKHKK
ncbi:uncharacterized protein LOC128995183 [Macrosteles quadrilineatus]|uniref:uncharacterized protein LOC128995183 n=1 Tax=Macrosteles quadrilineatus TaxID=74068 RepID=UPI0023E19FE0|nr:uncharacterized protein LOC128995183 [Macrosteles quadrilineatus]XP_054276093.1 uncharacterized protein LOC128995183 [Macrosteles quadrilineatus]